MSTVNCTIMAELSNSLFLRASLAINLVICVVGVPVFWWATWKIWSMKYTKLFHTNFKIVIQLHIFGFLLHCTGRIILHGLDLLNYTKDNPCDMIPNIYRCFIFRLMYNSGLWITMSTAITLIIERWIATKRSVSYEEDSVLIGVFLVLVQLFCAGCSLSLLYCQTTFEGVTMYYCTTTVSSAPYFAQLGAVTSILFQVIARISFQILLRINKRHRELDVHTSFSNRYQLEQNISSITCLKTFANLSSFYVIFQNLGFLTLLRFADKLEKYQFYAILELIGSWPTYGIVSIAILGGTLKKIRAEIEKTLKGHIELPNQAYLDNFIKQIS